MGYHRAGFDVVGVDIKPQKNYPFEFIQGDAIEIGRELARTFDAIHASPPCQKYTVARKIHNSGERHPDLVPATRAVLESSGRLWVIENVPGSPLNSPIMLCGLMFGLRVLRHRLFESNILLIPPSHPMHPKGNLTNSCHGYSTGATGFVTVAGHNFVRAAGAMAMQIDWRTTREELAQAIPPAYTEWIGRKLKSRI